MDSLEKGEKCNSEFVDYLTRSPSLASILAQTVLLFVPAPTQLPESLVSAVGDEEFDDIFNTAKGKTLEFANALIEHVHHTAGKLDTLPLFEYCKTVGPQALLSLGATCVKEHDKLEERLAKCEVGRVLAGLMRLLSGLLTDGGFYGLFVTSNRSIIVDILLVLLRSSEKDHKAMQSDPENFVNLAVDTCDKQCSETYKTEAARLLRNVCERVDGCLSFTSVFCGETIKYACRDGEVESLGQYPLLSQFSAQSIFIRHSSPVLLCETSILAISDLETLLGKRKDLLYPRVNNRMIARCSRAF